MCKLLAIGKIRLDQSEHGLFQVNRIVTHRAQRVDGTTLVDFEILLFEDGAIFWLPRKKLWETAPNHVLGYYEAHGGRRSEYLGIDDEKERFVAILRTS